MDPDSKYGDLEQNIKTKPSNILSNGSDVLQPFWVRYRTVLSDTANREFVEGQCRFVLYCGLIFWVIYLITS